MDMKQAPPTSSFSSPFSSLTPYERGLLETFCCQYVDLERRLDSLEQTLDSENEKKSSEELERLREEIRGFIVQHNPRNPHSVAFAVPDELHPISSQPPLPVNKKKKVSTYYLRLTPPQPPPYNPSTLAPALAWDSLAEHMLNEKMDLRSIDQLILDHIQWYRQTHRRLGRPKVMPSRPRGLPKKAASKNQAAVTDPSATPLLNDPAILQLLRRYRSKSLDHTQLVRRRKVLEREFMHLCCKSPHLAVLRKLAAAQTDLKQPLSLRLPECIANGRILSQMERCSPLPLKESDLKTIIQDSCRAFLHLHSNSLPDDDSLEPASLMMALKKHQQEPQTFAKLREVIISTVEDFQSANVNRQLVWCLLPPVSSPSNNADADIAVPSCLSQKLLIDPSESFLSDDDDTE